MKSLLLATVAYDAAICLFCLSAGMSVAIDAIWMTPRFQSAVVWIVTLQIVLVIAGMMGFQLMRGKDFRAWKPVILLPPHLLLALSAFWLWVVCDGAIWKATSP